MSDTQRLIRILTDSRYGDNYVYAKSSSTCLACGKPVTQFSTELKELEYQVSALCEDCQNRFYG